MHHCGANSESLKSRQTGLIAAVVAASVPLPSHNTSMGSAAWATRPKLDWELVKILHSESVAEIHEPGGPWPICCTVSCHGPRSRAVSLDSGVVGFARWERSSWHTMVIGAMQFANRTKRRGECLVSQQHPAKIAASRRVKGTRGMMEEWKTGARTRTAIDLPGTTHYVANGPGAFPAGISCLAVWPSRRRGCPLGRGNAWSLRIHLHEQHTMLTRCHERDNKKRAGNRNRLSPKDLPRRLTVCQSQWYGNSLGFCPFLIGGEKKASGSTASMYRICSNALR